MATRIPDTVPSNQRLGDSTLVVLCTFFANIFFSLRYMTNHFFVRSLPAAAELRLILLGSRRGWKCVRETFQASLRDALSVRLYPALKAPGYFLTSLWGGLDDNTYLVN